MANHWLVLILVRHHVRSLNADFHAFETVRLRCMSFLCNSIKHAYNNIVFENYIICFSGVRDKYVIF